MDPRRQNPALVSPERKQNHKKTDRGVTHHSVMVPSNKLAN